VKRRCIGILGGGISGVALASQLTGPWEVLEKEPKIGGLCSSIVEEGFTFDAAGPHIMFSKNKAILARMVDALGTNVHQRRRENKIWFKGHLVKYPFENGLSDLPKEDCFECILGYLRNPWTKEPTNLAEWSYATFGQGISDKYFLPYNRKIWSCDPAEITLEWVARIPKPPLEDVLKSAIGIPTEGYLHQLHFSYPVTGGYEALVRAFAARARGGEIRTSSPVDAITRRGETWVVEAGGATREYETLVSTLPIHELARVWAGFPEQGREALGHLRFNGLLNVLLGLREDRGYPYTALYVPDPDVPFHRISFPKAFSAACAPEGCSAIMAEITCRGDEPLWALDAERLQELVIDHLVRMDLMTAGTAVYRRVARFTYGYPVYDHSYFEQTRIVRDAVAATGLHLLGRFAQFDYINSDVCIERAFALAERL
jgi:protoporphyrinogen oxidase